MEGIGGDEGSTKHSHDSPRQLLAHCGGLVGMAAPFVWMLSTSFKGTKDIFRYPPPQWIPPQEPTLDNYRKLFRTVNIGRPLMNTVITAVSITGLSLIICSMAGYAFAKFEFPGKNVLFMGVLGTLMVPGRSP